MTRKTVPPQPGAARDHEVNSDADKFTFLNAVEYEVSEERMDRVWGRLADSVHSESSGKGNPRTMPTRFGGALVGLAACAATFGIGVWVGEQRGSEAHRQPSVVSAEPLPGASLPEQGNVGWRPLSRTQQGELPADDRPGMSNGGARVGQDATHRGHGPRSDATQGGHHAASPASANTSIGLRAANDGDALAGSGGRGVNAPAPSASNVGDGEDAKVVAKAPPPWQKLANNGDYEAALVEITQSGGFERILADATAEQLMLLSDVARATGQQQRALAALRRIVGEYAADPVAPLAALNLGNLLEKMGDGAGATEAFAIYRSLSPRGDFAEDALVRQISSAVSAGQQELARNLVAQYESDFPDGRRADEVARWSEQLPLGDLVVDAGGASEASPVQPEPLED